MNTNQRLPRSPELMSRHDTALLVVDVQGKLMDLVPGHARIIWNIARLIDGARILGMPVHATEQYPRGLGPTVPELAERFDSIPEKLAFSCGECPEIFEELARREIHRIVITGIEAHVCVMQTAFDVLAAGFQVYLVVDAIGARFDIDRQTALQRLESAGATLTTAEMALFEWCDTAAAPEFKQISQLVRQTHQETKP